MEKQFVQGMFYREPSDKAPKWVKGNLSFRVKEFTEFLMAQEDERGWVNIDLKESKGGKIYAEVNTYKPQKQEIPVIEEQVALDPNAEEIKVENIPF